VKGAIPPEMALIYWDYYHFDEGFYRRFIDRHLELVSLERLVMAPGAQTWNRFWTNYPYAVATIDPAMKVCREKGIRQLMITLWGDDGNECDPHSFLPMIQFFSDHAYRGEVKPEDLKENLWGSCGIDYHSWHPAGEIDAPAYLEKEELGGNPAKILLWEDPLYGLLQPMLGRVDLGDHFRRIAEDLDRVRRRKRPEDRPLLLPLLLCRILAVKWDLPNRIYSAYRDGRRAALKEIIKKDIPFLRREIEKMRQLHRRNWHEALQPWGWETLDSRYGSLLARLETLQTRLSDYLGRRIPSIPELERERRKIFDIPDGRLPNLRYGQVYTATLNAVN
jgi:hexosaminidase